MRNSEPPTRASVVSEIISLHGEIINAARTTLDKAIRIGELLTEQKASLKHGQWLPWVNDNLPFEQKTAWRYMNIYSRRDELGTMPNLELTDAYRMLAGPGPLQSAYDTEADELAAEASRQTDLIAFVRSASSKSEPLYPEHVLKARFTPPVEIVDLPVSEIEIDPSLNVRGERDAEWTKWLAQIPDLTPPIAVFRIEDKYFLADGRYRLDAAKIAKATHIRARIYTGTKSLALEYACCANSGACDSGQPYSRDDWQRIQRLSNQRSGA